MASYVEQATLRVNDQSTAQINKINAALKKLFATARSLKSTRVSLNVDARGLTAANKQLNTLARNIAVLRGQRLSLTVNDAGLAKARRDIAALRAAARAPINVNVRGGAAGAVRAPRPVPVTPAGGAVPPRRRGGRTPGGAIITGAGAGAGASGISRLETSFGALSLAAYGAAAALKKVAEAGYDRSRTDLQTKAMTTEAQRAESARIEKSTKPGEGPSYKGAPIAWPKNAFDQFVNEIQGDVAAEAKPGMSPKEVQEQTRRNAVMVARHMQNDIYPGIMARNPTFTPEQGREGLKKHVKAANISTTDIVDDAGKLSADYQRFSKGLAMALAVNPELKPETVRTTMAGLKTSGYTLDSEAIAQTLVQAGDLGQRVGNETFRLQRSLQGVVDNKKLNNVLRDRGILLIDPKDLDSKGNVKPSTGKVSDLPKLLSNPSQRIRDEFQGDIDKHINKPETQRRIQAAGGTTGTEEEKEARRKQAEQVERVGVLGRILPSLPQTALNQLNQLILGAEQWERQKAQARVQPDAAGTGQLVAENPAIIFENLKTAAGDAAGKLGELALSAPAVTNFMQGLTNVLRGEPTTPEEKRALAAGGGIAATLTTAVVAAFAAPVAAMTTSAAAQTAAAAAMRGATAASLRGTATGAAAAAGTGAAGAAAGGAAAGAAAGAGRKMLGKVLKAVPVVGTAAAVYELLPEKIQTGVENAVSQGLKSGGGWMPPVTEDARNQRLQQERQKKFDAERKTAIDAASGKIAQYEAQRAKVAQKISAIEEVSSKRELKPAMVEDYINRQGEAARLDQAIAAKKTELARIQEKPPTEVKPRITPAGPKSFMDELNKKDLEPKSIRLPPTTTTPTPIADPRKAEPSGISSMPPPTQTLDMSKMATENAGRGMAEAAASINSASGAFSSVFATVPGQMASGGQQAASIITSGAASAGAAYGAAAAAAIQAAVANVNVNVNVKGGGGGGDTGNINNANGNK